MVMSSIRKPYHYKHYTAIHNNKYRKSEKPLVEHIIFSNNMKLISHRKHSHTVNDDIKAKELTLRRKKNR